MIKDHESMKGALAMSYKQMIIKLGQPADIEDMEDLNDLNDYEYAVRDMIYKIYRLPEEKRYTAIRQMLSIFELVNQ